MIASIRWAIVASLGLFCLVLPEAAFAGDCGCCKVKCCHHHRDCCCESNGSKSSPRSEGRSSRAAPVSAIPILEVMPVAFMPMMSGRFVPSDNGRGTGDSDLSRLEKLETQVDSLSKAVEELRQAAEKQNQSMELIYQRLKAMQPAAGG